MPEEYDWSSFLDSQRDDRVFGVLDRLKTLFGIKWDLDSMDFGAVDLPEILARESRLEKLKDSKAMGEYLKGSAGNRTRLSNYIGKLTKSIQKLLDNIKVEGIGPDGELVTWWTHDPLSVRWDYGWYIKFEGPSGTFQSSANEIATPKTKRVGESRINWEKKMDEDWE